MSATRAMILGLSAAAALVGGATAQTVEFRFVERTGQSFIAIGSGDNVLSFAVQARVVGLVGTGIGSYTFDIQMPGEADTFGTLTKERSSNNDNSIYSGAPAVNNTVGRGGIPYQYSYLAGISASFNGHINVSGGTFTNTPGSQEIGLITGSCVGNALLGIPGIDVRNGDVLGAVPPPGDCSDGIVASDCNPDTWNDLHTWNSGGGTAPVPANSDTAPFDPAIGATYLGVGGGWVDVYRFRYTVSNLTPRTFTLSFANTAGHFGAQLSNQLMFNTGSWAAANSGSASVSVMPLVVPVGNPGACCGASGGSGGCAAGVDTGCTGAGMTFFAGGSCAASPCAPPGACCTGSSCAVGASSGCAGAFHAGAACNAGVGNPTTCCEANFDGMGGVEVKDIFEWINAFFLQDMRADSDHDGVLRPFDIFTFLQLWFAGCG